MERQREAAAAAAAEGLVLTGACGVLPVSLDFEGPGWSRYPQRSGHPGSEDNSGTQEALLGAPLHFGSPPSCEGSPTGFSFSRGPLLSNSPTSS